MSGSDQKWAWTVQVFGVPSPEQYAQSAPSAPAQKAVPIWAAAKDAADAQISALQAAFRASGDPAGIEIADRGLSALIDGMAAKFMAALMDLDSSAPANRPGAAKKAIAAVDALRKAVDGNTVLPLLEQNPYGVAVSIRAILTQAASQIEAAAQGTSP